MEHLIETVKRRPCLWSTECEEYKLFDCKVQAWKEVVHECKLGDVKEARTVWKKLRDSHRQAVARKLSGQVANPTSTWKYEKQMEFLLPSMRIGRRKTVNVECLEEEEENEDSFELDEQQNSVDTFISFKRNSSRLEKYQERKEARLSEIDVQRFQTGNHVSKTTQESAMEKFFMSMFLTTIQMPDQLQHKIQRQIFDNVMAAKEEWLAYSCSNSSSHPDPLTAPTVKTCWD